MAFFTIKNLPSTVAPTIPAPVTTKIGSKIKYDSTGKVLGSKDLIASDIPNLPISKIINLQSVLDSLVSTPELPLGSLNDILVNNGSTWIAGDQTTIVNALGLGSAAFYNVDSLPSSADN